MTRRLLLLSLSLAVLAGCADEPCRFCGEPSEASRALQNRTWRVRRLTFSEPPRPSGLEPGSIPADGFDLDGVDSREGDGALDATCAEWQEDFVSRLDPTLRGVDNAAQLLIAPGEGILEGYSFQRALDAALDEGRLALALRFGTIAIDGTAPVELLALEVDPTEREDLLPRPTGRERVIAAFEVQVGRRAARAEVSFRGLSEDEELVPLMPLSELEVRAIGVAAPDGETLEGTLGGTFTVDALVDAFVRATGEPGVAETVRGVFESVADLEPSEADPATCREISVGIGFEAVQMR